MSTTNPNPDHYEDDSRWDGPTSDPVPAQVKEAREHETAKEAELAELIRLVESGEDLSAEERIPEAVRAVDSARRIRKGVESQARKAAQAELEGQVDDLRKAAVATRGRSDEQVAADRAEAADALGTYVANLVEANTEASRLDSRVSHLRLQAEEFPEFSEGRLNGVSSMVRGEQSVVMAVAELAVHVLRPVVEDGPEPPRRERELYEILRAYLASDAATLQGLLRNLPGTIGHVSRD